MKGSWGGYLFSSRFIPYLLWCSEEENRKRMKIDHRDQARMERAIEISRKAYQNIPYQRLDITDLTAVQAAERIRCEAGL